MTYDNALPLAVERMLAAEMGGLAEPSRSHLRKLMRQVVEEKRAATNNSRDEHDPSASAASTAMARRGRAAREDIEARYHPRVVADQLLQRLWALSEGWRT